MPERVINTSTKEHYYQDDEGRKYVVVETVKAVEFTDLEKTTTIKARSFLLKDGTRIEELSDDPEAFKVFGSNKVIRKV